MDIMLIVLIAAVLLTFVIAIAVILRRARPAAELGLTPGDRVGAVLTGAGAVAVAAGALVTSVVAVIGWSPSRNLVVPDVPLQTTHAVEGITGTGVTAAMTETVNLALTEAPAHIGTLLLLAGLMTPVATIALAGVTAWLAIGLLQGQPFGRRFVIALTVSAATLVLTSGVQTFANAIARGDAASFADPQFTTFQPLVIPLDLAPWGVAFLLGLIAVAFSMAGRMQKDVAGLV
ncbi:hypothetical protein [Microbacterium gorillae]|uniref:hypothetical protein n=1 Tax=Microbacterium gorillae TaxID=1231063 RepID=UPI001141F137|nr:hypothetical protein [Microbacterium gorillae]